MSVCCSVGGDVHLHGVLRWGHSGGGVQTGAAGTCHQALQQTDHYSHQCSPWAWHSPPGYQGSVSHALLLRSSAFIPYRWKRVFTQCNSSLFYFKSGANIFLTSSGLIKLGDFGCSVKLRNNTHTMPGEVNSTLGTAGRNDVFGHQRAPWLNFLFAFTHRGQRLCFMSWLEDDLGVDLQSCCTPIPGQSK